MELIRHLLVLAVVIIGAQGQYSACVPVAQSCRSLKFETSKLCSSIISSANIPIVTCRAPQQTVTVTQTSVPTVVKTSTIRATTIIRTVYSTTTIREPTVTLAPTTIFTTTTTTKTESSTSTSVTTTSTTTTKVYTDPTKTISETTTSTKTTGYEHPTCPVNPVGEQKRDIDIPADCSCFLTKTALNAVPTTRTITVTKPTTRTSTTIVGGLVPTSSSTTTIKRTSIIRGSTLAQSTKTSTSTTTTTITSISTTSTTSTSVETEKTTTTPTTTETKTSTSTLDYHPCDSTNLPSVWISDSAGSDAFTSSIQEPGTTDPEGCCRKCYSEPGCVAFIYFKGPQTCTWLRLNQAENPVGCAIPQCPNYFVELWGLGGAMNPPYVGIGPCAVKPPTIT